MYDNKLYPTVKSLFRRVVSIIGEFNVSNVHVEKPICKKDCTVNVLSGVVWINPNTIAAANNTSIKLTGTIDLYVEGDLSLISDVTGAKVQIIVWGE